MDLALSDLHMMLGASFEMFGQQPPEFSDLVPGEGVTWAVISAGGEPEVNLAVGCDEPMLQRMVEGFGGPEAAEAMDPEFVSAVLRELANVLGGNLRGALSLSGTLSLPQIAPLLPAGHPWGFETWDGEGHMWLVLWGVEVHG